MFEGVDRPPILHALHALRTHVELDTDVSNALTALHAREGARLAELLREVRILAGQLDPSSADTRSRLDLETWLGTILRGPHDRAWFDTRIQSGRRGWAEMPPLSSAILIARVRHLLTEMTKTSNDATGAASDRVASALGRLFDLEMAIVVLNHDGPATSVVDREDADVIRSTAREAALTLGNSLAVIETSAYLIGRYSDVTSPRLPDIERHLERIAKQVDNAKKEVRRLLEAARSVRPFAH